MKKMFVLCLENCKCKFEENLIMEIRNINTFDRFLFNHYLIISFFFFSFALYLRFTKNKKEEKDNKKTKRKLIYNAANINLANMENDYTEVLLDE